MGANSVSLTQKGVIEFQNTFPYNTAQIDRRGTNIQRFLGQNSNSEDPLTDIFSRASEVTLSFWRTKVTAANNQRKI